jgi:aminoglycoside phosphotransferase (APT) family kinase protein
MSVASGASDTLAWEETRALLAATLNELYGADAALERWSAMPFAKRGKHGLVRYDLHVHRASGAGAPAAPPVERHQWVGKVYERALDGQRVAGVLRVLAATPGLAGAGVIIPRVLGYWTSHRLLLMTYEAGESVIAALARDSEAVLATIGQALAALHSAPVALEPVRTAAVVLASLRAKVVELCARLPREAPVLSRLLVELEQCVPPAPARLAFLHGDCGPAQLLWTQGRVVVLDLDDCARGDPASDLGNLFTQLHRLTLRKPGKLPAYVSLRRAIFDAYRRAAPADPTLGPRVAWYERMTLVRKIHSLACDGTRLRHQGPEAIARRQAEALRLVSVAQAYAP